MTIPTTMRSLRYMFCVLLFTTSFHSVANSDDGIFSLGESPVLSSPNVQRELTLAPGESVVDYDVAPFEPLVAALVKNKNGAQAILFWNLQQEPSPKASMRWALSAETQWSSITWHSTGKELFLRGSKKNEDVIVQTVSTQWKPLTIYRSSLPIRRLVVAPRPYEVGYYPKNNQVKLGRRIFFGVRNGDGSYSTRSILDSGKKEYTMLAPTEPAPDPDWEFPANTLIAKSALPSGFHPEGTMLIWEDEAHCFHRAHYDRENWARTSEFSLAKKICGGSLTYTPNGAGLLHWEKDKTGVAFASIRDTTETRILTEWQFDMTPSSVADGRGLVVVTHDSNGVKTLRYLPTNLPLADVVNAWMYLEDKKDEDLLVANSGLLRQRNDEQLYQLYESESYSCGGYDTSTPSRPYFVTTDIFWEVYAAAFEGIFIVNEKQAGAAQKFWQFVDAASHELATTQVNSRVSKIFSTLSDFHHERNTPEAELIRRAEGSVMSEAQGAIVHFGMLKPRSHYTSDVSLSNYFKGMRYLLDADFSEADNQILMALSETVKSKAKKWIDIYTPFMASPRFSAVLAPHQGVAQYYDFPRVKQQLFPQSWGWDNQVLFNVVYHSDSPTANLLANENGYRQLPHTLEFPAALGNTHALTLLETEGEFASFPGLRDVLSTTRKNLAPFVQNPESNLYAQWLAALAVQWSDEVSSPQQVIGTSLWQAKRLQTGLASWVALRHATALINEVSVAECGEGGFEFIRLRPPRGYVEPDAKTFRAIAHLFDVTAARLPSLFASWDPASAQQKKAQQDLRDGVLERLAESAKAAREFAEMADKEVDGKALSNLEYEKILYVGRAAEHNFLVFKSLLGDELGLSAPDPVSKVAVVAGGNGQLLHAGIGRPLEWNQVVPFFGRKVIVKGAIYSYKTSKSDSVMDDVTWRAKEPVIPMPDWVRRFVSTQPLSCPAREP